MNIYALELNNDIKGISKRKLYIEDLIKQLEKPDIVVLPELALCSYIGNDDIWQYADNDSEDTSKWAIDMAKKYNTYIAVGYLEKSGADYYNSYLIADKHGVYGIVRKSESEFYIFKTGEFPNIIETPIGNIAVGICYDSRRKHLYDNIKDKEISLILFPHGCPSDPKKPNKEQETIDYLCNAYVKAFNVPVVYVNSKGKLGFMLGRTGAMMAKAGFVLNGMSKIYSLSCNKINTSICEAIGISVDLVPQTIKEEITFYGNDIIKGNWLFRKFIMKSDIKAGIRFYNSHLK